MLNGAYSMRYKGLEQQHMEHLKEDSWSERTDLLARNKRFTQETNRRRKAIAIKRKLEVQREEKRRQEILSRRRNEIRNATERYQRSNRQYSSDADDNGEGGYPVPSLEEALHAVRGSPRSHRHRSSPGFRRRPGSGHHHHRQRSAVASRHTSASSPHSAPGSENQNPALDQYSAGTSAGPGRSTLHDRSLRNLTSSRSLFEEQLQQHQQKLAEQQQDSLAHFNHALMSEMEQRPTLRGEGDLDLGQGAEEGDHDGYTLHSESVSSVDSLEGSRPVEPSNRNVTGPAYSQHASTTHPSPSVFMSSPVTGLSRSNTNDSQWSAGSGFILHSRSSSSQSNVAVVAPSVVYQSSSDTALLKPASDRKPDAGGYPRNNHLASGSDSKIDNAVSETVLGYFGGSGRSEAYSQKGNRSESETASTMQTCKPQPAEPQTTRPYNVVTSGKNGRYNGHYFQDTIVNYVTGATLDNNSSVFDNHLHCDPCSNNKADTQEVNPHLHAKVKAWSGDTATAGFNVEPNSPAGQIGSNTVLSQQSAQQKPHVGSTLSSSSGTAKHSSVAVSTNSKPFNVRTTTTNTSLAGGMVGVSPSSGNGSHNGSQTSVTYSNAAPVQSLINTQNCSNVNPHVHLNSQTGCQRSLSKTQVHHNAPVPPSGYQSSPNAQPEGPHNSTVTADGHVNHQNSTVGFTNGVIFQPRPAASSASIAQRNLSEKSNADPLRQFGQTPYVGDREDEGSVKSDTYSEESHPEPAGANKSAEQKVVKGILKKPASVEPQWRAPSGTPTLKFGGYAVRRAGLVQRSHSANAAVRDSVEITKDHIHKNLDLQKARKKGVRFADLVYEEEEQECEENENGDELAEDELRPIEQLAPVARPAKVKASVNFKDDTAIKVARRPPRPASAKTSTVATAPAPAPTTSTGTASKIPRSSSAGTPARGPFLRPHPPAHPPSGRAAMAFNHGSNGQVLSRLQPSSSQSTTVNGHAPVPSSPTKSSAVTAMEYSSGSNSGDVRRSVENGVYDANGVRLDRTPTDEEINWLWDKVRTCLRSSSASPGSHHHNVNSSQTGPHNTLPQPPPESSAVSLRQTATVSQKYIDGDSITPQLRVANRVSGHYANNYMGTAALNHGSAQPKKRVTMEALNNMTKRASLLQQRKTGGAAQNGAGGVSMATTTVQTLNDSAPIPSTAGPIPSNAVQNGYRTDSRNVTESMAAFLAAENLAKHSASEGELEQAMDNARLNQQAYNVTHPPQKVPSALSIEEQRLMVSLDRLNERLKLAETNMYPSTGPAASHVPKPPPYASASKKQYASFKGHQPLLHSNKRQASTNGTVPRHHYRAGSATLPSNYKGTYRYR